jgi:hypothetical protein
MGGVLLVAAFSSEAATNFNALLGHYRVDEETGIGAGLARLGPPDLQNSLQRLCYNPVFRI